MKTFKQLVARAEWLSTALATASAPLEADAWSLDSALSALRKDDAGYRRGNAANATGGDNYTPGELEKAVADAEELYAALEPMRALIERRALLDLKLPELSQCAG